MMMRTFVAMLILLAPTSTFAAASAMDIKGCLKQALEKENPLYQVPEDHTADGYNRYLVLICNKAPAKDLYESLDGPTSPGDWNGRTRGDMKFLAQENGASMCYHITRDAEGERADDYNCSIRLNIDAKQLGKTQTSEMIPFPVK